MSFLLYLHSNDAATAVKQKAIEALQHSSQRLGREIENDRKKRAELVRQVDVFGKCLQILLDTNLCRVVIQEDSIISDLIGDSARAEEKVDADRLFESLNQIQEMLLETANEPHSEEHAEKLQSLAVKFSGSNFLGDAYYDRRETKVEELVDKYMERRAPQHQGAKVEEYGRDFLALLTQMDELHPLSQGRQT